MSNPLLLAKDLSNLTIVVPATSVDAITAGGSGDNTAVVGLTIDRDTLTPYGAGATFTNVVPFGVMFCVAYQAVLAAAATLTIKNALVQDSADGTTWTTIIDQTGVAAATGPTWPTAGVVDTGGTGGTTQRGVVVFGSSIAKARRYVRFGFTPDLSATGTDTATIMVTAVLSGIDELPPGVV